MSVCRRMLSGSHEYMEPTLARALAVDDLDRSIVKIVSVDRDGWAVEARPEARFGASGCRKASSSPSTLTKATSTSSASGMARMRALRICRSQTRLLRLCVSTPVLRPDASRSAGQRSLKRAIGSTQILGFGVQQGAAGGSHISSSQVAPWLPARVPKPSDLSPVCGRPAHEPRSRMSVSTGGGTYGVWIPASLRQDVGIRRWRRRRSGARHWSASAGCSLTARTRSTSRR